MALSFTDREHARYAARKSKEAAAREGVDLDVHIKPVLEDDGLKYKVYSKKVRW